MSPGSKRANRTGAATAVAACAAVLLLASCSSGSPPHRAARGRAAPASPPATWAPGVTATEAAAGTATDQSGIQPWLAPVAAPAPTVARSRGCARLRDPGWRVACVRVDTGEAVLTGVVESRPGGTDGAVWRVAVWRANGVRQVETMAAGDSTTPLWAWAAVRSADLLGNGHRELVFGFEQEGTGEILDLAAVDATGTALLGSQIAVYRGTATVSGRRILAYHPIYRPDDPNCCPTGGADRDAVEWEGGGWVVVGSGAFALPGSGRHAFPNDFGPPPLR